MILGRWTSAASYDPCRAAVTKLNPEKVVQIRELRSTRSQGEIAARFGVDRRMFGHVLRGKVWREDPAA